MKHLKLMLLLLCIAAGNAWQAQAQNEMTEEQFKAFLQGTSPTIDNRLPAR